MITERLVRWAEQRESLKRFATADALVRIESNESPPWLRQELNVDILKDYRGRGVSEYYTSVLELNNKREETISIEPERSFAGIDFYLRGIEGMESARVVGEFLTESGETRTDMVSIAEYSSFNAGASLPIHLSVDEMCTAVDLRVEFTGDGEKSSKVTSQAKNKLLSQVSHRDFVPRNTPRVGMPVPVQYGETAPPVILVSIDTLRYDTLQQLQPVLSALGEDATVPAEPRTAANWTPPSHASMFTGVHPGEHKYVGVGNASGHPIHPDLVTLPELLTDHGYKCSGAVSHTRILPEGGFGRGFYRYYFQNMTNWLDRHSDARTGVNRILRWIERDRLSDQRSERLFYFLHVFDPHLPYIPDHPSAAVQDFDLKTINTLSDSDSEKADFDEEFLRNIKAHYEASVAYTARQIRRLITGLKTNDLFDDALIIVTGDHGELFGEYGTYGHTTLYDPNIRPFMTVKPPAGADWSVPETASTIDFLPTIATTVGAPIPDQCQGSAWQRMTEERTHRITEAIKPDSYRIAVEENEISAIFTYPDRYPERPGETELQRGPVEEEYYRLADTRTGQFEDCGDQLEGAIKQGLLERATEFLSAEPMVDRDRQRSVQALEETKEQLRHLGYK